MSEKQKFYEKFTQNINSKKEKKSYPKKQKNIKAQPIQEKQSNKKTKIIQTKQEFFQQNHQNIQNCLLV